MTDFPNLVLPGDKEANDTAEAAAVELKAAETAMPELAPTLDISAAPSMPTLTLPNEQAPLANVQPVQPAAETQIPEVKFSPEEQQVITAFAERIDITDSSLVLGYGAAAQSKISKFTESALEKVRTHDLGEAGDLMSQLMVQLKGFTDEEPRGFLGIFRKAQSQVELMKSRYDKVQDNVD